MVLLFLYFRLILPSQSLRRTSVAGISHIFSIYGDGMDKLKLPSGVDADADGNIYVADTGNGRIMKFDPSGQTLLMTVIVGSEEKARAEKVLARMTAEQKARLKKKKKKEKALMHGKVLYMPYTVSIAENGDILATVPQASKLFIYSSDGVRKKTVTVTDQPFSARYIDGRIYVCTRSNITVYSGTGEKLEVIGRFGKADGMFDGPQGLAIDKDGTMYVADTLNYRVQALSRGGKVEWVLGKPPRKINEANRTFGLPIDLVLNPSDGELYVLDAFRSTIQTITVKGKKLSEVGEPGNKDGQFNYPVRIVHVRDNVFAIADKYNNRIQVVAITSPGK